jgi:predicted flavoprotein YhiN
MVHTRIAQVMAEAVGLKADARMESGVLARMARVLKDYRLTVIAGPDRAQAQAIRGGLAVEGFDPATLQSRGCPRIFAAGECLDVDGPCGGFNLHWAWASGLVAGESAGLASRRDTFNGMGT